ncbi:MAG TPA: 5-(carboxyamino)imidazole ribonucleotide synthase [Polyangiaceae bacterium]|nr:5-(carboxyamino)imidazole ribonucleotide synthase [Polyangiaceae bacterium]
MAERSALRVGLLGAGQLGRMLALAGYPLDVRCLLLDPTADSPGSHVAEQIVAEYTDPAALARLAECDVVSYEFENVPASAAAWLAERVPVYPPPAALEVARDRLHEKTRFRDLGIPTARFKSAESAQELEHALSELGVPALIKTRTLGYDGKGQLLLRDAPNAQAIWGRFRGVPLIVEEYVAFQRELSLIAVRSTRGDVAFYPLVQNEHRDGILHLSQAPAPNTEGGLQHTAEDYASRLLASLDYAGVLALELFEVNGALLANEMAPRVHNSGHWTIEGAEVSQFENHLRAILGLPLGSTAARGYPAMLNLIGNLPDRERVLAVPGAHLHLYGKAARAGRKLGHVTLSCNTAEQRCERVDALLRMLSP